AGASTRAGSPSPPASAPRVPRGGRPIPPYAQRWRRRCVRRWLRTTCLERACAWTAAAGWSPAAPERGRDLHVPFAALNASHGFPTGLHRPSGRRMPVVGVGGRQRRLYSGGGAWARPVFSPEERRGSSDAIPYGGLLGGGLLGATRLNLAGAPISDAPPH